ncbi:hypothetical protein O181_028276 [Austropuccinia psidii MF-1]|uniref:Uncharacterized protein n=1 Tax=Austropuccinia psidii MF-1 TaxID=1389203 RepID=A0A9Q3H281_9BASI|nr:hypothetical protein [Austropuccinia psidii MF-1]
MALNTTFSLVFILKKAKANQFRWPLENVKDNPPDEEEIAFKIPINFLELDWRKTFIFSQSAPEGGTLLSDRKEAEGKETPIIGM